MCNESVVSSPLLCRLRSALSGGGICFQVDAHQEPARFSDVRDEHLSMVKFDDAFADRESESGAFSGGLCGKERLENTAQKCTRNPRPLILYFDHADLIAGT